LDYNNGNLKYHKIKLSQDKEFLHYKTDYVKTPKISSHTLVDMLGKNKWTSAGAAILSNFGLTKRSPFDPYQGYKGGIAEEFAGRYLRRKFGPNADIEAFTVSQFKNFNQFPEAAPFSGVLDIMVHEPLKLPVEVKSKEMKDYEWIALKHMYPQDQLLQGANQAMLAGVDRYMMLWVFLSKSTSDLLREIAKQDLWIWGEDYAQAAKDLELEDSDFKFHSKEFPMDSRLMNAYREKALKRYEEFHKHRRVDRRLFTAAEWKEIKKYIEAQ